MTTLPADRRVGLAGTLTGSLAVRLASAGAAFGLHAMLARLAGAAQYGTYSYALAWLGILVLLSTLGLDVSLVKYVAAYRARADWGHLKGIVQWSQWVVLAIVGGIAIVAAVAAGLGEARFGASLVRTFRIGCAALPVMATLRLFEARLIGCRRVVLAQAPDGVMRPVLTAAMAALLFWLPGRPFGSADAMALHLIAVTAAAVAGAALLRRVFPSPAADVEPRRETGAWLRVSLPLWMEAGVRLLSASIDVLLVGTMLGMAEAGVYAIANRIAELITFGTNASQTAVRPYISEFHAEGNRPAMQRVVATASVWASVFAVAACGIVIPARALLLQQFGDKFLLGASALAILSLGYLVSAGTAVVHAVMNMTDRQRANLRISAVCLAVKAPLSFWAISGWGVTGAAVVSAGMMALSCLWSWHYVRRNLGIDGTVFSWFRVGAERQR